MDGLYQRPWLKSWWKWNDKEFFRLQLNLLEPILHSGLLHFAIFFLYPSTYIGWNLCSYCGYIKSSTIWVLYVIVELVELGIFYPR